MNRNRDFSPPFGIEIRGLSAAAGIDSDLLTKHTRSTRHVHRAILSWPEETVFSVRLIRCRFLPAITDRYRPMISYSKINTKKFDRT